VRRQVEALRPGGEPFDLVAGGPLRGDDWDLERERIRAAAGAGATWHEEWIPPGEPDAMRATVACGPLRID
jgi:hypothetical protein